MVGDQIDETPPGNDPTPPSLLALLERIRANIPDEERRKVPVDGSINVDYYLYGTQRAVPIDTTTLNQIEKVAGTLIDPGVFLAAGNFALTLRPRTVCPMVVLMGRGLQFEWYKGNRSLKVEFETAEQIRYSKMDTDEGIKVEGSFPVDFCQVHDLIDWLEA